MSGKLIVFEGTDGSGKATQARMLCRRLETEGTPFREIDFPRYGKPSAAMVQEYLDGNLGKKPGDVNAYAASMFFSMDRYASYKQDWGDFYENGGLVVANRYTTSIRPGPGWAKRCKYPPPAHRVPRDSAGPRLLYPHDCC